MTSFAFLRALVAGPLPSERITSATSLRARIAALGEGDTVERAALSGFTADGVGWAFAGGYQAALARLDPVAVAGGRLAALCATEEGGGHPRAIRTTLTPRAGGGWILSGRKTFVTLGADADVLLVVAKEGEGESGRNRLRVARVERQPGVTLTALHPLPFTPEVGHASAVLDSVVVGDEALLEGDGYERALKPFRTIEDTHVMAALLGWAIGLARTNGWDRAWLEDAATLLVVLREINQEPLLAPETHLVLAGAIASVKRCLDGAPWASVDEGTRERWLRDRPLLEIASVVRQARRDAAWKALEALR